MTQSPEDTPSIETPPGKPLQFRLVHLIYITSMLAASLSLFELWGLFIGGMICFFWIIVFFKNERLVEYFVVILIMGILIALLAPWNNPGRGAGRRFQCITNLRQIGVGLHNYHDTYDSFPPAYIADASGKPMHSWRVLILPHIDQIDLYEKYDFNEPWDGPSNKKLLDQMPQVYACPNHEHQPQKGKQHTSYLAITGENTAWPEGRVMTFSDFPAGPSNTVMVTEFEENPILWLKPKDIDLTAALEILSTNDPAQDELNHPGGRLMVLADSYSWFEDNRLTKETWRQIIQIDLKFVDIDYQYLPDYVVPTWVQYNLTLRNTIFMVLIFLPVCWFDFKPNLVDQVEAEQP